jgi:glyoxylase I family protein
MSIDRRSLILGASTLATLGASAVAAAEPQDPEKFPKERVEGIGGFFFRSHDAKTLAEWYQHHLGIGLTPTEHNQSVWQQAAGPTAFQPFPMDTKYLGSPEHAWMMNFRVRNLDAMVAQLRGSNIAVDVESKDPTGGFARLKDPEGNPIQLWEPAKPTSKS